MTTSKKKSTYRPGAPAVEQAAQLLLCLGKHDGEELGLTEICRRVGIHKSKGFSILNALSQYDIVTKDPQTKTYALGPALMPLAQKAKEKFDIITVSKPILRDLAADTRASVLLGIISNDQFFISSKCDGNENLTVTIRLHQSLHITHGAHGKAIFAHLDPAEQQRIFESNQLFFHGDTDKLDKKLLEKELKFCRKHGYAVDDGMQTPGTSAVSAPIFDHNHKISAAVVVVGTFAKTSFTDFGQKTARAAARISRLSGDRFI